MAFEHQVTCRFFQVDRAGILFFGRIFEFCHVAFEELFAEMFGQVAETFVDNDLGMPIVHCEADFKRPIDMQNRITVRLEVDKLTERSIAFSYTLVGEDGVLRATAKVIHAFVSLSDFQPKSPPESLTDGLKRMKLI